HANACALQAFEQGLRAGEVLWSTKMKPRLPAHDTLPGMGYAHWNSAVLSPSGKGSITSGHFVIAWLSGGGRDVLTQGRRGCERVETDEMLAHNLPNSIRVSQPENSARRDLLSQEGHHAGVAYT